MLTAILAKLIPIRDYLYAALIVALLIFGWREYRGIEAEGAAREAAAVAAASTKAQAAAQAANNKLIADYDAALTKVKVTYAESIKDADAAHAADLQRLRERASSGGGPNPAANGTPTSSAPADAGAGGAGALGSVPAVLAEDLAVALRADDAALTQCYAERDSLTGK